MKYLIIGAGGTGGSIGGFLANAKKDVTLIARGAHLHAMEEHGLSFETTRKGNFTVNPIKVCDMEHYEEKADVIFVCVKGYSLEDTIPFIKKASHEKTIVIPLLNIYGTGKKLQEQLPEVLVTDGCIYIVGEIKEAGKILQSGDIFRIVYGVRNKEEFRPELEAIKQDLEDAGIDVILSDNIQKDALQKFSFVSPMAACGAYYDVRVEEVQKEGDIRSTFIALIEEINEIAKAMNISLPENIVEINLEIMDQLAPNASASMQRDIWAGKASEIDGLVYEVVRLGKKYGVPTPMYDKVAEKFS
ncbi:MAG TPA: 2-dehydropantoate 2-reductase [Candidatus Scybalomonas excrementigallinarum]|nr:2-dehydropantoate 2-reductase [Candidatus Scybalomonas excrementigallinarum]